MIRPEELRIGNLTDKGIVTSLPMGCQHSEWEISCDYFDYKSSDINPIPITEEWLIKLGFEKEKYRKKSFISPGNEFYIEKDNNNGYWNSYKNIYEDEIILSSHQYIHQLQNLFFTLTGQELTLQLKEHGSGK